VRFLKTFTELPMAEIREAGGAAGRRDQTRRRRCWPSQATKLVHGAAAATEAAETARKTFEEGGAAEGLPTVTISRAILEKGVPAYVLFKDAGLAASNGEARRLIEGGGAKVNDEKAAIRSRLSAFTGRR